MLFSDGKHLTQGNSKRNHIKHKLHQSKDKILHRDIYEKGTKPKNLIMAATAFYYQCKSVITSQH